MLPADAASYMKFCNALGGHFRRHRRGVYQKWSTLGTDPWLVVIMGRVFLDGALFGISLPVAIFLWDAMGVDRHLT